uniref:Max dimerization protein 3 n=1 Tax=Oryctolagus cuniculus TaxID=9986 RepID=A0A5F9DVF0_RABIT
MRRCLAPSAVAVTSRSTPGTASWRPWASAGTTPALFVRYVRSTWKERPSTPRRTSPCARATPSLTCEPSSPPPPPSHSAQGVWSHRLAFRGWRQCVCGGCWAPSLIGLLLCSLPPVACIFWARYPARGRHPDTCNSPHSPNTHLFLFLQGLFLITLGCARNSEQNILGAPHPSHPALSLLASSFPLLACTHAVPSCVNASPCSPTVGKAVRWGWGGVGPGTEGVGSSRPLLTRLPGIDRSVHNELEKRRRAQLKRCLEQLKQQMPLGADCARYTTLSLLRRARTHIQKLEEQEQRARRLKERLRSQQQSLRQQLERLRGLPGAGERERLRAHSLDSSGLSSERSDSDQEELDVDVDVESLVFGGEAELLRGFGAGREHSYSYSAGAWL